MQITNFLNVSMFQTFLSGENKYTEKDRGLNTKIIISIDSILYKVCNPRLVPILRDQLHYSIFVTFI
jgi:hypothetical protein